MIEHFVLYELLRFIVPGTVMVVLAIVVGGPIARALARRLEPRSLASGNVGEITSRLERIEHAVDAIAIEVERMAEADRFTAKLLAERAADHGPSGRAASPQG